MIDEERIQQLAGQAQRFLGPQIDVTGSVLNSICNTPETRPVEEASLLPYAIVAIIAASVTVYFGMEAWTIINNPALEIVQSMESLLP